jgi:Uma2 family endonuclease
MGTALILTEAEYDALPEKPGYRVELDRGVLVMTASARMFHNKVRDNLGASLKTFARAHSLGEVFWETDFRLDSSTIRIPDLAFLTAARMAGLDLHQRPSGAPDLAVEVVSPSNDADDLARKVQQYLQTGAQLVWVVYPESRIVYVHRPGERVEVLERSQSLTAPALLPAWSLPLAELFR